MKKALLLPCLLALASYPLLAQTASAKNNLMPVPEHLAEGSGSLALRSTFVVATPKVQNARLNDAIDRTVRHIEFKAGLRHAGKGWGTAVVAATPLTVSVDSEGEAVQSINEDESYSLKVTASGVELHAATVVGAMRGLETLYQLVQPATDNNSYVIPFVSIEDAPRFRWRGLMIDCGRHFEPISVIKRNIDAMAAVKLNVFHWHLTEDQGFRMESREFPQLTAKGSDGLYYTQEEARDVVAYARARGIRVVPEFEMPGHSAAWLYAYPELSSGTVPTGVRREFGVSDSAIDPTREETYVFIQRFLTEMAAIFPDQYVHIGGDETPAPDWKKNPRILAFMKEHKLANNDELQAYFNTRVLKILSGLNKRMMGWDEILTPSLPKDIAVQSWRGIASLSKGAKMGYDGVLSAPYYLDGMKTAEDHYLADPIPADTDMTADEQKHILGGETPMWAEQLGERTIDSRIWPRAAAIAERFWSPRDVRNVDDMYRRLQPTAIELEGLGVRVFDSEDEGLRQLAGSENIAALRIFADALEPVSFSDRFQQQHTDQLTPLDNLVDAVRPDPWAKHWFATSVKRVLANPTGDSADREALTAWLGQLQAATPEVIAAGQHSPRLAVARVRAEQVKQLAAAGREALDALGSGKKLTTAWQERQLKAIAEAKKPSAVVRIVFLAPLEQLVKAVPVQ